MRTDPDEQQRAVRQGWPLGERATERLCEAQGLECVITLAAVDALRSYLSYGVAPLDFKSWFAPFNDSYTIAPYAQADPQD